MRGKLISTIAPVALAVLCIVAAGCNSSGNANVPTITCTLPTGTTTVNLVYPIPGASGVPDNLSNVIIATNMALPSNWQVILVPPSGYGIGGGGLTTTLPSPLPTPNALATASPTPSPSPSASPTASASPLTLQASSFAQSGIYSATTFQVGLNNTASNCNSYPIIGTFTSQ